MGLPLSDSGWVAAEGSAFLMTAPFVLVEDTDILCFRSLEALLGWVEPGDVQDGIYKVFDSSGTAFRLVLSKDAEGREAIRVVEGRDAGETELRALLVSQLKDKDLDASRAQVPDLIAALAARVGWRS